MANPSLQIGNSNWAIKESNLLGYSTAGTKFLPQPITMTRASAGTRVNSSGLIETVELLGSELVDCSSFDCADPAAAWIEGSGWSFSGGKAKYDGTGGTSGLVQSNVIEVGKQYKIIVEVLSNQGSGNNTIYLGGSVVSQSHLAVGTHTFYGVTSNTNVSIYIYGRSGEVFELGSFSVKEVTRNNLARVDYDGTASSLLVEPQRTNLITYSEDFSNSYWTKSGASVTSGIVSPDGTANAYKLVEDSANSRHFISSAEFTTSGTVYSSSVFVKASGRSKIAFRENAQTGKYASFNLSNGTLIETNGVSASIELISNGWYRINYQITSGNSIILGIELLSDSYTSGDPYANPYQGDGSSGVQIYGGQVELGSYPTSYIPTSGSSVTRVKDIFTRDGIGSLIGQTEGTIFIDFVFQESPTAQSHIWLGSSGNEIGIYGNAQVIFYSSGGVSIIAGNFVSGQRYKLAFAYKANDYSAYNNGVLKGTDTSASVPTTSSLYINSYSNFTEIQKKQVNQVQLYKTRLSNSQLATLTTI